MHIWKLIFHISSYPGNIENLFSRRAGRGGRAGGVRGIGGPGAAEPTGDLGGEAPDGQTGGCFLFNCFLFNMLNTVLLEQAPPYM